ncbi:MAG: EpsG family protein [Paludibacter sp.]
MFCFAFFVFSFVWVNKLIQPIINVLSIYNQYGEYLSQTEEMIVTISGIVFNTCIFIINIVILLQLHKEGKNKNLINLFLISILVNTLFLNLYGNFGRVKYSIGIINVICYAYYFKQNRLSKYKIIMFISIIIVYGYILIYGLSVNSYGQVPYYLNFNI